jgi:hypothetical protein
MAEYQNKATQHEKLEALRNDTYQARAQNQTDDPGGRYAKVHSTTVTGTTRSPVPKQPENSFWAKSLDEVSGPEPPLGFSIEEN